MNDENPKPKSNAGRHTKMTPERQEKILQCIALGMSKKSASAYSGISQDTFYEHVKRFPEFSERVNQAMAKFEARHLSVINKAAMPKIITKEREKHGYSGEGKRRQFGVVERTTERTKKEEVEWMASAWLLERVLPETYGRVDRHLIHTTGERAMLPEEAIQAISRALGVTGKLVPLDNRLLPGSNGDAEVDLDILPE